MDRVLKKRRKKRTFLSYPAPGTWGIWSPSSPWASALAGQLQPPVKERRCGGARDQSDEAGGVKLTMFCSVLGGPGGGEKIYTVMKDMRVVDVTVSRSGVLAENTPLNLPASRVWSAYAFKGRLI
jgi:hypothetical protein